MKKKKYVQPECDIVYSYDLESELMYGNTFNGGGGTGGLITGSGGGNLTHKWDGSDDGDDSDRAKGNNIWGVSWDY